MSKRKISLPGLGQPIPKIPDLGRSASVSASSSSRFLELPAEIRLLIYGYLVCSSEPLQGGLCRKNKPYNLSLSILRTSRLIHREAQPIFYHENTFHFSSSRERGVLMHEHTAVDPPVDPCDWSELRHISIDLIYIPPEVNRENDDYTEIWNRDDPRCAAYIRTLTSILELSGEHLRGLKLVAEVPESSFAQKSLGSFFACDRDRAFVKAISVLNVEDIPVQFDFPDSFFYINVPPAAFLKRSILLMSCQVMFCQAQTRIERLLETLRNGRPSSPVRESRIDLSPLVSEGIFKGANCLFLDNGR